MIQIFPLAQWCWEIFPNAQGSVIKDLCWEVPRTFFKWLKHKSCTCWRRSLSRVFMAARPCQNADTSKHILQARTLWIVEEKRSLQTKIYDTARLTTRMIWEEYNPCTICNAYCIYSNANSNATVINHILALFTYNAGYKFTINAIHNHRVGELTIPQWANSGSWSNFVWITL